MIQPDTISSFGSEDKVPENSSAPSSQPSSSIQDAVVPSTSASQGKKLSCKTNQSDRVLAYLKASVRLLFHITQVSLDSVLCAFEHDGTSRCRTKLLQMCKKKITFTRGNSLAFWSRYAPK